MQTLEKRIAALEQANPPTEELTIIRRIVWPGHLDAEISRLRSGAGEAWERLPGETEQELVDRASREVKRNAFGVARLVSGDGEACHVEH